MNKSEFVSIVASKSNISVAKCRQILENVKAAILEVCCKGEEISIRNFGRFSLRERKPRRYLNPQTKRYYLCAPKKLITFKSYFNCTGRRQ